MKRVAGRVHAVVLCHGGGTQFFGPRADLGTVIVRLGKWFSRFDSKPRTIAPEPLKSLVVVMVHDVLTPIIPVACLRRKLVQELGKSVALYQVNHPTHL
jgi:hypothetical protein